MLYLSKPLNSEELDIIQTLSDFFKIPTFCDIPQEPYYLIWENKAISLHSKEYKTNICVDFEKNSFMRRIRKNQGELIVKAINLKKYHKIWDVTAGLGTDSFLLASFGAEVTLFERNPIVAALLWDGLRRARQNEYLSKIVARMHFNYGSILNLNTLPSDLPDVVYLDPMFPQRKKSAQVKKEMIFLQKVVGEDLDHVTLFEYIKTLRVPKIVVKRSKLAPHISDGFPLAVLKGQATRFDIY